MPDRDAPWLEVPLEDYESHMNHATVGQLGVLSQLFASVLAQVKPSSVAILGIAGGNGLEHIESAITKRVVGIDINANYLEQVRQRFPTMTGLELHHYDLSSRAMPIPPVSLVHAALILEHTGLHPALDNALALVEKDGALSVVLQRPSLTEAGVSVTPYQSLQKLKSRFQLIDPDQLRTLLSKRGFEETHISELPVSSGKSLWLGIFRRL